MADPTAGIVELTADQQRRIAALRAAREVLVARGLASSEGADPIDLHSIAEYIVTGNDPWPPRPVSPTPEHRLWWRRTDG